VPSSAAVLEGIASQRLGRVWEKSGSRTERAFRFTRPSHRDDWDRSARRSIVLARVVGAGG
jgi:hypothetical protein